MKNAFYITPEAAEKIRRMVRESGCSSPVARMYERAEVRELFRDVEVSLLDRDVKDAALETLARSRFQEIKGALHFSLMVRIDDGDHLCSEQLLSLDGVKFVLSSELRDSLMGYHLAFDAGVFSIRNSDNQETLLSSIVTDG